MTTAARSEPKKVLVTGGAGFVGTYVCRFLAQRGQQVVAFGLEPLSPESAFVLGENAAEIPLIHGDIRDAETVSAICLAQAPDAISPAAGLVGHDASLADPAATYAINIGGTVNVLEAARKAKIRKVVLVSSNAAYHKKQHEVFDETHPTTSITVGNPNAHYGASKVAAEQIALTYQTFHDIEVVVVRITSAYGFGMKAGQMQLKQMLEGAALGKHIVLPSGGAVPRDYTYVEDAASGIVAVLNADTSALSQRVYNISRGELTNNFDIADSVRAAFPEARLDLGNEMTEFEQATLRQRAPLSWECAHTSFGYRPQYTIRQGIKRYAEIYGKFLARSDNSD